MTVITKKTPIASLGLGPGVHFLKVVVDGDTLAYEVASSSPAPVRRMATGFVKKWSGSARKLDDSADAWLEHIHSKHFR